MSSPTLQGGVRSVSVWSQARAGAPLEKCVLFWCVRRASLGGFQVTPCGSSHPPRLLLSKRKKWENLGEFLQTPPFLLQLSESRRSSAVNVSVFIPP